MFYFVHIESSLTLQPENSCSYEAGLLEQPDLEPPADMWTMTVGKFVQPRNDFVAWELTFGRSYEGP